MSNYSQSFILFIFFLAARPNGIESWNAIFFNSHFTPSYFVWGQDLADMITAESNALNFVDEFETTSKQNKVDVRTIEL